MFSLESLTESFWYLSPYLTFALLTPASCWYGIQTDKKKKKKDKGKR